MLIRRSRRLCGYVLLMAVSLNAARAQDSDTSIDVDRRSSQQVSPVDEARVSDEMGPSNSAADSLAESSAASAPTGDLHQRMQQFQEDLQQVLRSNLGPPLKSLHAPVDKWLAGLPMWVAVACAVGLYVGAAVWVWMLSREFVFRGAPDQKSWRDLRVWATVIVLPYIAIYLLLGR